MRQRNYTPGPWSWWPKCCGYPAGAITQDGSGSHIAKPVNFLRASELTKANAHLIAAAPELLEALEELSNALTSAYGDLERMGNRDHDYQSIYEADQAIKKAYGETP